jgi:hypothetical protein
MALPKFYSYFIKVPYFRLILEALLNPYKFIFGRTKAIIVGY